MIAIGAVAIAWPSSRPDRALATGEPCSPARPHTSGTSVESIVSGGQTRSYRLHVPPFVRRRDDRTRCVQLPRPRLERVEQEISSGLSTKSDSTGFIAVFPDGSVGVDGKQFWNAWQLESSAPSDVAFVNAMLDSIEASLCIDENRMYASGVSNGAMMSVRVACSISRRFAAFAPVAGAYFPPMSLQINTSETCPDAVVRPMIAFHGTADASCRSTAGVHGLSSANR